MKLVVFFILMMLLLGITFPVLAADWAGVDETVVEHYAKEYGREARAPYINTDQGDLLLFIFTLAGAVGGFVAGYNWRKLFGEKRAVSAKKATGRPGVPKDETSHA
jgi:ABC-type cobalt transport system substrate-binding protein